MFSIFDLFLGCRLRNLLERPRSHSAATRLDPMNPAPRNQIHCFIPFFSITNSIKLIGEIVFGDPSSPIKQFLVDLWLNTPTLFKIQHPT